VLALASGPATARRDLRRSVRLFRAFQVEQSDPARFYRTLADDSVRQLLAYGPLESRLVLDVGGGPGFFRDAFVAAGAAYVALDTDAGELSAQGLRTASTVVGSGMQLPIRTASVDLCYSSNVLEHVPDPWRMADEMVRVTRPGGLVFLSYTVWLGPWGGHETSPWHYAGGAWAARRYTRRHGHPPKNVYGRSLFAVSVRDGLRWARGVPGATLLAAVPRYAPSWADRLVDVPGVREVATWNLALVLRRA
jgi:SAM-dependent methyltransferase